MTSRVGLGPLTRGGSKCGEVYYSRDAMRSMVV